MIGIGMKTPMKNPFVPLTRSKASVLVLSLLLAFITCSCIAYRLRRVSPAEKRNFVISPHLDEALIDPLERGPLNSVVELASDGEGPYSSPLKFIKHQRQLIKGDIIRVGYGDNDDDMGADDMSGSEKTSSVMIAIIIVVGVLAGATVPLLFALHVI